MFSLANSGFCPQACCSHLLDALLQTFYFRDDAAHGVCQFWGGGGVQRWGSVSDCGLLYASVFNLPHPSLDLNLAASGAWPALFWSQPMSLSSTAYGPPRSFSLS